MSASAELHSQKNAKIYCLFHLLHFFGKCCSSGKCSFLLPSVLPPNPAIFPVEAICFSPATCEFRTAEECHQFVKYLQIALFGYFHFKPPVMEKRPLADAFATQHVPPMVSSATRPEMFVVHVRWDRRKLVKVCDFGNGKN